MHNEFVVEFKDGTRDWVDPVLDVKEDESMIYVYHTIPEHVYQFEKCNVRKWIVRPYSEETTYNWIEK